MVVDVFVDDDEVDVDSLLVSSVDNSLLIYELQWSPLRRDSGKMLMSIKEKVDLGFNQFISSDDNLTN